MRSDGKDRAAEDDAGVEMGQLFTGFQQRTRFAKVDLLDCTSYDYGSAACAVNLPTRLGQYG